MAFDLNSITKECITRPPRIVLLGVEKIGKSTFASKSENPIFIPIKGEEGIDGLKVDKFPVSNSLVDIVKCLRTLVNDDHGFKTVVLDSVSTAEPLVWKETARRCVNKDGSVPDSIEKVHGGYSKGYIEALNEWDYLTTILDELRNKKNMMCILIGHVVVKRFDDPEGPSYDQYQFDINSKAVSKLYRWSDLILFANKKTGIKNEDVGFGKIKHKGIDISGGERFLFTQKRPSHPGGGRDIFGHLPYELPLSWAAFQQAIVTAMQQ